MRNVASESTLSSLLATYDAAGGVLDYVFLGPQDAGSPHAAHRAAALAGMAEIDRRLEQRAMGHASKEYPIEMFFRLRWDVAKLTGESVSFSAFWGNDDVEPKPIGDRAWTIPKVDGYKTAFFHPPYGLRGSASDKEELFAGINSYIFGGDPERTEIFSWSTDWSNYFEAGHEWWGAFFWTIRQVDAQSFVVIGASSTD
jgi:hypothetical protein